MLISDGFLQIDAVGENEENPSFFFYGESRFQTMSPDLADIDIAASLVSLVISIELRRISMTCPEHCD